MEIKGHHTCKKSGGEAYVLKNAPFLSTIKNSKIPFLGIGYYFWDDNIEMAKYWGWSNYNNNYYIVENDLDCQPDVFLDLVGNRKDMRLFVDLMDDMIGRGINREKWTVGAFIEFMKRLRIHNKDVFPYQIIRAVDNSKINEQFKYYFVQGRGEFTNLSPIIVICVIDKIVVNLNANKIIQKSN